MVYTLLIITGYMGHAMLFYSMGKPNMSIAMVCFAVATAFLFQ